MKDFEKEISFVKLVERRTGSILIDQRGAGFQT